MSKFLPSQPDGARITSTGGTAPWAMLLAALLAALLALLPPIAAAEDEPGDIPASDNRKTNQFASCSPLLTLPEARTAQMEQPYDPEAPATLEADYGEFVENGFSVLEGDAIYSQSNRWLNSEHLEYNAATGQLKSDAPTRFLSGETGFDTKSINYNTQTRTGDLGDAEFYLFERHARGEAARIILENENRTHLQDVMYTTCSAPDQDWYLRATDIELDQETGVGVAKNMWITFMHVPFIYIPWMDFPIDGRRKSGLLFPEFGYSSSRGDFLRVPYYFNIAPNYDATFAPYFMKKRGTRLDGQFRYLNVLGKGTLDFEYLENDRITQTTRYRGKLNHAYSFGSGWLARLNYNTISDPSYLEDLSDSGRATEVSYLAQTAQLTNAGTDYSLRISARKYETVDPTRSPASAPYSELPAIDFKYLPMPLYDWIEPSVEMSATDFRQEFRTEGTRQHIQPELALNLGTPGVILRPAITHWQSKYDLERPDGTPLELERSVTIKSLDLGLILERSFSDGGKQTLEPRLFYLDIPYVDQDAFPLFDTRRISSQLDQLFRVNRFTGIDRLGDTRQLAASLSSRFIEPDSGRTWLEMQVARARYFEDRRVTLSPGGSTETFTESDVFAALQYSPTKKLDLRLDASIDPGSGKLGIASMRFGYAASDRAELNLSYSFRRDIAASPSLPDEPLEQAGISFIAPVGSRWKFFGKAIYSVPEERSLETMTGFEYESCCWAFRTFQRRYIRNRDGDVDSSLWFQVELKGLANVGRGILDFLGNEFQAYGEH